MKRPNKHVFAIVRVDEFLPKTTPWSNRITVKEIVLSQSEAKSEVERLNKLNADKKAIYFWQLTRLIDQKPASP